MKQQCLLLTSSSSTMSWMLCLKTGTSSSRHLFAMWSMLQQPTHVIQHHLQAHLLVHGCVVLCTSPNREAEYALTPETVEGDFCAWQSSVLPGEHAVICKPRLACLSQQQVGHFASEAMQVCINLHRTQASREMNCATTSAETASNSVPA